MTTYMRDLVPWSIIYGVQNERHAREIQAKTEECITAQTQATVLACMILKMMLNTSSGEWGNSNSEIWRYWDVVKKHITPDQIDDTVATMLSNHRTLLEERYPNMSDAFMSIFELDIHTRSQMLKALL